MRCKFSCRHIDYLTGTVHMEPVYSGSKENRDFFAATPSGKIELQIVSPTACCYFEVGRDYYVDFEKAPEGA